ncbi:fatty-acyl-CoA synthase [Aeromicrobium panaciterrae]|uniref:Fatty-acyl-CoA synthase n=1 Tax=Aeromicrobium panaciterrae TaxID=363861 RepID=A0ABU1UJI9_9ACTN|nr:AMP-binding protein [Aeromicrobium panaciterrae]MDR7085315.1 fatty-acyl-CoA synthase [Aeromicrobium panaciterrae]
MQVVRRLWVALMEQLWVGKVLFGSRMMTLMRPDKYVGFVKVIRTQGTHSTSGFALAAVRAPNGIGIVDERGSLTWTEIQQRAGALGAGLIAANGGPVESVAILARNHRGFVDALLASTRIGAHALLLNTGFSGPQLAEVMEREGARVIVYDEEFDGVLTDVRGRVDGLVEVLAWTDGDVDGLTVDGLIGEHLRTPAPHASAPGRVVLLTSGTTGSPKGAQRSGGGPDELAGMLEAIPWRGGQKTVVAAPMFHAWGFGQLVIAATMTCTAIMRRRFDPEATLALVDEHDATGLSVVPVMLERIMDLPADVLDRYSLDTLRFVSASGSRMRPDSVIAFMDRFGDVVHNSYNATEVGQISVARPADLRIAPDTAGRAVRGSLVRIVDDEDADLAAGEVGRIAVRGTSPFDGYTSGASKDFIGDYMVTGDVGRLDSTGLLFVIGRDDDMIVSGGENVYPIEVEKALGAHDAVREVVVVGVPDEAFGQRLAAYVVPNFEVDAATLKDHVRSMLAGYKVPREVVFLDELPRNASGKVMARELPAVTS